LGKFYQTFQPVTTYLGRILRAESAASQADADLLELDQGIPAAEALDQQMDRETGGLISVHRPFNFTNPDGQAPGSGLGYTGAQHHE
jgi:hypothetical protein